MRIIKYVREKAAGYGMMMADLAKLSIMVIGFKGRDPGTRHKEIHKCVRNLLNKLQLDRRGMVNDASLRDQWGLLFQENAGDSDTSIKITKADFVWPIIVMLCNVSENEACFGDYDDDFVQDTLLEYSATINYQSQKFELFTKLVAAFEAYAAVSQVDNRAAKRSGFISEHWEDYVEELGLNVASDAEVREIVAKLILQKVLYRQRTIKVVKEGVNLAD